MVAQESLKLLVLVRIQAGQPIYGGVKIVVVVEVVALGGRVRIPYVTPDYERKMFMEMKIGTDIIRHVFAPGYDWSVLYHKNKKIWEGHDCNSQNITAIVEALGGDYYQYEFTDRDEIDGCTPNSFVHIKGIKEL